jgi:hypothetical protein
MPKGTWSGRVYKNPVHQCEREGCSTLTRKRRFCSDVCRYSALPSERFWAKISKDGPVPVNRPDLGPCWIWTPKGNSHGYGVFTIGNSRRGAHVVSYEWANGLIPDGLQIDHLCRVRRCVRPSHLEAVPAAVNKERGESPAARNARKTHCSTCGRALSGENLYRQPGNGYRSCVACRAVADARYVAKRRLVGASDRPPILAQRKATVK